MNDELQFFLLNYTHEKLEELLHKLDENMMLTQDQYDKLINKIGLDNISTFSGNYYDLMNTPLIPTKTSQLMNNSGLLDLYHYEELNEQLGTILNRLGDLEPRVEELEAIPDIIIEVNEIEERIANIQEDIIYLQEFCLDYKIDFENLYGITMEIKEVNDTLENRLVYTNEKINLCIDLVDLNTTDISTISNLIQEINGQIDSLKSAKKDLEDRAERVEEAMALVNASNLQEQLDDLQHQFDNAALDRYATEETVVAFLDKTNQVYQEYYKLVQDTNQLEARVNTLAIAAETAKKEINLVVNNVEQNAIEINSIKNSISMLSTVIESLSDVDLTLVTELNARAEQLEESLANIQNQINKLERFDFVDNKELNELKTNLNDEIYEINQSILAMNTELSRLTQIDHTSFVTNERMINIESKFEMHNSKANAEINEIKSKLSRFEKLNVDTVANIAYVDSKATELTNLINEVSKKIDTTNYKIELLTVTLETLQANYDKKLEEANEKMELIDEAINGFNNKHAEIQTTLLAMQAEINAIKERLDELEAEPEEPETHPCTRLEFTIAFIPEGNDTLEVGVGESINLKNYLIIEPSNCTDELKWFHNGELLSRNGDVFTGIKEGTTTVMAMCGNLTATTDLIVSEMNSVDNNGIVLFDNGTKNNDTEFANLTAYTVSNHVSVGSTIAYELGLITSKGHFSYTGYINFDNYSRVEMTVYTQYANQKPTIGVAKTTDPGQNSIDDLYTWSGTTIDQQQITNNVTPTVYSFDLSSATGQGYLLFWLTNSGLSYDANVYISKIVVYPVNEVEDEDGLVIFKDGIFTDSGKAAIGEVMRDTEFVIDPNNKAIAHNMTSTQTQYAAFCFNKEINFNAYSALIVDVSTQYPAQSGDQLTVGRLADVVYGIGAGTPPVTVQYEESAIKGIVPSDTSIQRLTFGMEELRRKDSDLGYLGFLINRGLADGNFYIHMIKLYRY